MIIIICIIAFIIFDCIEEAARKEYNASKRTDAYYNSLMKELRETRENIPSHTKRTTRHIAQDKEGNIIGEEIIEEEL